MFAWLLLSAGTFAAEPVGALHTLCTFKDVRWEHHAALHLPGTTTPWATASGWAGNDNPLRVDATLGERAAFSPVVSAEIRGGGTIARGELDPQGRFRVLQPTPLGPAATLLKGATVHVIGGGTEGLRVGTPLPAAVKLPPGANYAEVPCSVVSLHAEPGWITAETWWSRAGLPADAPTVLIRAKGNKVLLDGPNGTAIGRLPSRSYALTARELGRSGGFVEIAWTTYQGTLWRGWISSVYLEDPQLTGGLLSDLLGALGSGGDPVEARACAEPLPITARVGSRRFDAGTLGPNVPFRVLSEGADHVTIAPLEGWLRVADGATWEVPVLAATCPISPWKPASLAELFQGEVEGLAP